MIGKRLLIFYIAFIAWTTSKATPYNIAPQATITASTILNNQYAAANIADGLIGVDGKGEWACEGVTTDWGYIRFPWIQLEWETEQAINRIVLFDRPSLQEHI